MPTCNTRHGRRKSFSFPALPTPLKDSKMLNKKLAVAFAVVFAIACLAEAREENPHDVSEALRMLQELDRLYTQAARPRYGKRSEAFTNWAKDLEKPDLPAWLSYARRR
ncbi:hypothetical protein NE865_09530 [Phthorimaea operculella]|nr:hypothetical protein NE865_09530 [Phthorimaea operculella]